MPKRRQRILNGDKRPWHYEKVRQLEDQDTNVVFEDLQESGTFLDEAEIDGLIEKKREEVRNLKRIKQNFNSMESSGSSELEEDFSTGLGGNGPA